MASLELSRRLQQPTGSTRDKEVSQVLRLGKSIHFSFSFSPNVNSDPHIPGSVCNLYVTLVFVKKVVFQVLSRMLLKDVSGLQPRGGQICHFQFLILSFLSSVLHIFTSVLRFAFLKSS